MRYYFCTDTTVTARDILEAVAARWAIEEHFHDVKEVWGAGEQQVRNVCSPDNHQLRTTIEVLIDLAV